MDSNNNNFNQFNGWDEEPKQPSNSFIKKIRDGFIIGIVAGLTFTGVSYAGNKVLGNQGGTNSSNSNVSIVQTSNKETTSTIYDVSSVANEVMPSMVSIDIKLIKTYSGAGSIFGFGGGNYQQEVSGSGSGIIFSQADGKTYVLTNYHVVEDATSISCTFIDDSSYQAKLVGYDEDHDLAVVEVSDLDKDTLSKIKVAVFANEDELTLGQPCIAIGNALGYGQSVTVGYVSATAREVQTTDNVQTLIQTDAAINPGNSGGALLNMKGEVIGVNSAKYSDTDVEGMGFAIPVKTVMDIIPDLIKGAKNDTKPVYLGITGTSVTQSYIESFGWPEGVYVSSITDQSPAQQAGLQAGDIIVQFNDITIKEMTQLQQAIQRCKVDEEVIIKVARQQKNGEFKEVELTAKLAERPAE